MRSTILSTLTLAAALVLGACSDDGVVGPSTATIGPELARGGSGKGKGVKASNRIAFTHKSADGTSEIYTMNPDGTYIFQVTTNPGHSSFSPRWTPDHARIVLVSTVLGAENIYSINADGTFAEQLTFGGCADRNPAPSPDGTRIAFQRACAGGGIFVMNIDGSNPKQLTFNSGDRQPAWSPDGAYIAFVTDLSNPYGDIWRMNADGSNLVKLIPCGTTVGCHAPMYSPDGQSVSFWAGQNGNELRVIGKAAYGVVVGNLGANTDYAAAWSPDGTKLVFAAGFFGGDIELYSINTNSTGLTKLVTAVGADVGPSWHQ